MTTNSPFILFDVMDTLVYDPVFEVLPRILNMPIDEIWASVDRDSWPAFERGEMTESEYFSRFFADGRSFPGELLLTELQAGYRWLDGIQELLENLNSRGIPMYAASNYPIWFQHIEDKLHLSQYLDWQFVSCKIALRKPSPEYYQTILRTIGKPASAGVFVDNMSVNVEASINEGLHGIVYSSTEQTKGELLEWLTKF